jgi:hypothetical protein
MKSRNQNTFEDEGVVITEMELNKEYDVVDDPVENVASITDFNFKRNPGFCSKSMSGLNHSKGAFDNTKKTKVSSSYFVSTSTGDNGVPKPPVHRSRHTTAQNAGRLSNASSFRAS